MTTGTWKQADGGTSCVRDIVGFLSFGGAEAKSFIHISWINTNQDMGKIVDVDCYELLWVVLVLITLGIVGNLVSYAGSREAALAWAFRCGAFTTFNALDPEITHVTQLNKGFPLRVPFLNSLYSIYWQIFSSRCYVANCVDFSWLGMLLSTLKAQRQIHTNNISESWDLELRARIVLCPLKKEVQCITARKLQVIRLQLLLTQPWCWIWCRFSSMCFQTHVCRYLCPQTRTLPIKKMTRALFSSCFSICWSYVVHPGFVVSRRSVFWMCPGWKLVPVAPGHQKRTSQGWIRKTWTALRHSERRSVRLSSLVLSFVGFCRHSRRQQVSYNPPCDTVRSALFGNVRKIAHGLRRVHCQKAAGRKRFWCEISLQDCSGLLVFPFPLWDTVDGKMSTSLKDGRCYLSTGAGSLSKYVAVGRWKELWQPLPTSGFFMCKYFDRQLVELCGEGAQHWCRWCPRRIVSSSCRIYPADSCGSSGFSAFGRCRAATRQHWKMKFMTQWIFPCAVIAPSCWQIKIFYHGPDWSFTEFMSKPRNSSVSGRYLHLCWMVSSLAWS